MTSIIKQARRLSAKEKKKTQIKDKIESLSKAMSYYESIGHDLAVEDKAGRIIILFKELIEIADSQRQSNTSWLVEAKADLAEYTAPLLRARARGIIFSRERDYDEFVDDFLALEFECEWDEVEYLWTNYDTRHEWLQFRSAI